MLDLVQTNLVKAGVRVARLDGTLSVPQQAQQLARFRALREDWDADWTDAPCVGKGDSIGVGYDGDNVEVVEEEDDAGGNKDALKNVADDASSSSTPSASFSNVSTSTPLAAKQDIFVADELSQLLASLSVNSSTTDQSVSLSNSPATTSTPLSTLASVAASKRKASITSTSRIVDCTVLLVSTRMGATGLNLVEADTVVLYEPCWNPAMEKQAKDRVHRIGQTKPVTVHRLFVEGSVETRVMKVQKMKERLAAEVLERSTSSTVQNTSSSSSSSSQNASEQHGGATKKKTSAGLDKKDLEYLLRG